MRNYKGSVSLFTAMIFLMVVSVITATIRTARVKGATAVVGCAAAASLDSVFAAYNSELFSKFGVLLFDGSQGDAQIEAQLLDYMSYNTDMHKDLIFDGTTDLYGINQENVCIKNVTSPTDYGGLIWQEMVVEYEKYAKPIDIAADYLGIEDKQKEATETDNICSSIQACTTYYLEIAEETRELVSLIDGVQCGSDGIDFANIQTTDRFLKQFCPGDVSPSCMQIDNFIVYGNVSSKAKNVKAIADNIGKYIRADRTDLAVKEMEKFRGYATKALDLANELTRQANYISKQNDGFEYMVDLVSGKLDKVKAILDVEVYEGLSSEVSNLKECQKVTAEQICDIDKLQNTLREDIETLKNIIDYIKEFETADDDADKLNISVKISELLDEFSFDNMRFDYENLKKTNEQIDILESLTEFIDKGILAFVVPKDADISMKRVVLQQDAASAVCDYSSNSNYILMSSTATRLAKDVIYTEYVMDKFGHYTYKDDSESSDDHALKYEAEYILYGKTTDVENLTAAVFNIATIRSGFNMLYLLTDSEKKEEAYAVALMIAGASAMEPLIRLVQYTLLYLWAFAEGFADVRTMLSNGKVPILKQAEDWKLSLENLMAHSLDTEESDSDKGMTYEDFIRFLICTKDDGERAARTMDLVEFQMMKTDESFRLGNMVYGLEAEVDYSLTGISRSYSYSTGYTY